MSNNQNNKNKNQGKNNLKQKKASFGKPQTTTTPQPKNYPLPAKAKEPVTTSAVTVQAENEVKKVKVKTKKTASKIIGIKSVNSFDGKVVVSSFKNTNDSELQYVSNPDGTNVTVSSKFPLDIKIDTSHKNIVSVDKTTRPIANDKSHSKIPNPVNDGKAKLDYLKHKSKLEIEFFGQEFPNDNIRIQIINNILDIDKIYSEVVNNIVYTIQNTLTTRDDIKYYADYIGMFPQTAIFEDYGKQDGKVDQEKIDECHKFLKRLGDYSANFNNIFTNNIEHNYYVIQILSIIRNQSAHYSDETRRNGSYYSKDINTAIYKPELSKIYKQQLDNNIKKIKDEYDTNCARDLYINGILFPGKDPKQLFLDFYDYSILKTYKNLGISIKKIREYFIEKLYSEKIKDPAKLTEFIEIRKKINKTIEFSILQVLTGKDKTEEDKIILQLREIEKDKKDEYYKKICDEIYKNNKPLFDKIYVTITQSITAEIPDKANEWKKWASQIKSDSYSNFSYVIAFLCNFITSKEINDFITSLISKFLNISGQFKLLNSLTADTRIKNDYSLFEDSEKIAKELTSVLTVSLRKAEPVSNREEIYDEAIYLLGLGKQKSISDYAIYRKTKEDGNENTKVRNFLLNSVIKSSRYKYVSNYLNPVDANKFIQNKSLVKLVLSNLPEDQLKRYCENVAYYESTYTKEEQIRRITNILIDFNVDKIINANLGIPEEKIAALRCTTLYLTVIYIIVKQLIRINTRYFIALGEFEKDYYFQNNISFDGRRASIDNYYSLLNHYLNEDKLLRDNRVKGSKWDANAHDAKLSIVDKQLRKEIFGERIYCHYKPKWTNYLNEYLTKSRAEYGNDLKDIYAVNRNNTAHLSIIKKSVNYIADFNKKGCSNISYFELYHYIGQRLLVDSLQNKETLVNLKNSLNEYAIPNKDFMKYLYLPFAYNLPRYKNLTIKECYEEYDKNN